MKYNKEIVDKMLAAVFPLPAKFGVYSTDDPKFHQCQGFSDSARLNRVLSEIDPQVVINYGMTKMVIIAPSLGEVVIKIPFNGFYSFEEGTRFWYRLPYGSYSYCMSEYKKFCKLKHLNLKGFLAKTIFYEERDGVCIFLQERVNPRDEMIKAPHYSFESQEIVEKWQKMNTFPILDAEWTAACIDKYGKFKTEKFLYYCMDFDNDLIEDWRDENIGYRNNGTPVILDYANFLF